ncbi:MAG: hypothetical protein Q8928_10360 [Bacteroidota bacterium]|nr:hypothetical protein [Bacteroidota bacterium]
MKNKRLIYFLLPLVLFIWGAIFYKIFAGFDSSKPKDNGVSLPTNKNKSNLPGDTISLVADYRDPFLEGYELEETENAEYEEDLESNKKGFANTAPVSKPVINVPEIKYYGVIANNATKKKTGIFRITGKDCILKEGELSGDFKIVKLFNDSAKIAYQQIKKTVKKGN